jgi:uncharacterized protein (TIGR00156 family)
VACAVPGHYLKEKAMRFGTHFISAVLTVGALISPLASAQYTGPSTTPAYRSVADVLKNPVNDAPVVLEGYVIKQLEKDKYTFSDGTTEMKVEIEQKYFPSTPINEKTKVQIRGKVEKKPLQDLKIEVE